MAERLRKLTIKGFKSIESLEDFELGSLNVLIGANGAGKSNFVDFFRLLRAMVSNTLTDFVRNQYGSGDNCFFLGPRHTKEIAASLTFGATTHSFSLVPTANGDIYVGARSTYHGPAIGDGSNHSPAEKKIAAPAKRDGPYLGPVNEAIASWMVYHFHDTTALSPMRREQSKHDDRSPLRSDASNIAPFLYRLRQEKLDSYALIRDTVRMVAPFFDDFLLEPRQKGPEELLRLEWRQRGSDFPFQAYHLSDGTIRFICLATALLQPEPPATVVIDEPELGLHPYAISVLAGLIQSASERTQVIVSTQSPTLLDHFGPEDVIVVNREKGRSTFHRLDQTQLSQWLEEYSVGELWQKNVIEGGPTHE